MKFTQIILLLAATLAFVGFAAAGEQNVDLNGPCKDKQTDADCDRCCEDYGLDQAGLGRFRSGVMVDGWTYDNDIFKTSRSCYCAPVDVYEYRSAPWRSESRE